MACRKACRKLVPCSDAEPFRPRRASGRGGLTLAGRLVALAFIASLTASGALAGTPAPSRFFLGEVTLAEVAASCGGIAPRDVQCGAGMNTGVCLDGCEAHIGGTLGFTGTVRASILGANADGSLASVWKECSLVAGNVVAVGSQRMGYCVEDTNARERCGPTCVVLHPPFLLQGTTSGTAAGTWTVSVVRG